MCLSPQGEFSKAWKEAPEQNAYHPSETLANYLTLYNSYRTGRVIDIKSHDFIAISTKTRHHLSRQKVHRFHRLSMIHIAPLHPA